MPPQDGIIAAGTQPSAPYLGHPICKYVIYIDCIAPAHFAVSLFNLPMASRSIRSVVGLLANRLPRSAAASPTASLLGPVFATRAASQPVLALVREFHASLAPQTANLAKVLKDELTYEREEYEQAPVSSPRECSGWE